MAKTMLGAQELPVDHLVLRRAQSTNLVSKSVTIPPGAQRVSVYAEIETSTHGEVGDEEGLNGASGELVTVVRRTSPNGGSTTETSQRSVTWDQHHVKWSQLTNRELACGLECGVLYVGVGVRVSPGTGLIVEGRDYSAVIVVFS
jgi:hypothetical protein